MDGDDVRMTDPREQPSFFDDRRGRGADDRRIGRQQFQRDFTVQPTVPGTEHFAECAAPDRLEHLQMTP